LDKIEAGNFLNEILSAWNLPSPSLDELNQIFNEFDIEGEGVITKSEMPKFVKKCISGE